VKTAAHIRTSGAQPLDSDKQVNRKNVVSVEGLLNRIFPIAPLAAGLYKPQITQITQIFCILFLYSVVYFHGKSYMVFSYLQLRQNEQWVNRLKR
jgi:hypothetical protein